MFGVTEIITGSPSDGIINKSTSNLNTIPEHQTKTSETSSVATNSSTDMGHNLTTEELVHIPIWLIVAGVMNNF